MMDFVFHEVNDWPSLAWLAVCHVSEDSAIDVMHGSRVETFKGWFCEAVWAGDFAQGGFDLSDVVMGTGGRARPNEVVFVSSGSTVDRLQFIRLDDRYLVSNSLACLLSVAKANVDPCDPGYYLRFRSIVDGLDKYWRRIETTSGPVELVYFDNIAWDGRQLNVVKKPLPAVPLNDYRQYRAFLDASMSVVGLNMQAPERKNRYRPLGTVSTGYDSPTAAVLTKPLGLEDVVTFSKARGGATDDGSAIAKALHLNCITVDRDAWRDVGAGAIVPFLATNAYGEEAHYGGLGTLAHGRVLFTGYHGDKVWGMATKNTGANIVRGDPTGLSLSEYRLAAGFIHFPLPFLGVRRLESIHRISNSPEMHPWDVGGDYSRPIPRRIVEEAGVSREMFGTSKRAVSLVLWNPKEQFLPPAEMDDYTEWLRNAADAWRQAGMAPPLTRSVRTHRHAGVVWARACAAALSKVPHTEPLVRRLRRLDPSTQPSPLFFHLFPWAIDRAKRRYRNEDLLPAEHRQDRA